MILKEHEITQIKKAFQKMKSKKDFLSLLNYTKKKIYGEKTVPFRLAQINFHAYININEKNYYTFEINKKSGEKRTIMAPYTGLKSIQKTINLILQCVFSPSEQVTGFVGKRSIVDNARLHSGSNYVFNLDLKDFFSSIDQARVWRCLQNPPFYLSDRNKKLELANLIAGLCCTEMIVERIDKDGNWVKLPKRVLPQGAPTSPTLSNVICQKLDYLLNAVARRFGLRYSRYADDITFSSMHNVYETKGKFISEVYRIIKEQNFHIQPKKVRLQKNEYRQEVTGLVVNKKVNLKKSYVKQIRRWLYLWKTYGIERAKELIWSDYYIDKGHIKKLEPNIRNLIRGKLAHMKLVKGPTDKAYLQLNKLFDSLNQLNTKSPINSTFPDSFHEWETDGYVHIEDVNALTNKKKDLIFPHNPRYTVAFLSSFKYGDGKGFKELVHDVDIDSVRFSEILYQVKHHPNFTYRYNNERLSGIHFLNKQIQTDVINLINRFEIATKNTQREIMKHPFNHDRDYTVFALGFKAKYRYGSGREYSIFKDDILRAKQEVKLGELIAIDFSPSDDRNFGLRANFFTWQPSIYRGLKYIFEGIRDHSNIEGIDLKKTKEKKIIKIACERKKTQANNIYVEVSILDVKSNCLQEPDKLLSFLQSSQAFKDDFRNICDWIVECDFIGGQSLQFKMLVSDSEAEENDEIIPMEKKVGGFKHILKFYDIY